MSSELRILTVISFLSFAIPLSADPLRLTAEPDAVTITSVSPGGEVVLFGLVREPREFESRVVRHATVLVDDDRDGVVRLDQDGAVSLKSVWFAADVTTGAFATTVPSGSRLREIPLHALVRSHLSAGRGVLETQRELLDLVIVRPGVGAWHRTFAGDDYRADLGDLVPLSGASSPLASLASGDIVFLTDGHTMQALATAIR